MNLNLNYHLFNNSRINSDQLLLQSLNYKSFFNKINYENIKFNYLWIIRNCMISERN